MTVVGPSGSHSIIGPLQKASGPRKKEKTAMSQFWNAHHKRGSKTKTLLILVLHNPAYGACPKNETSRFFLFFSAHWPSATVR